MIDINKQISDMENTIILLGIIMKENLKIIIKMEKVNMFIVIKMYMKEIIKKVKFMGRENIHILKGMFMKVNM